MKEFALTADQMKRCDLYTIEKRGVASRALMERAADAAAKAVINENIDMKNTLFVLGSGNNGGDGFAMARFLSQYARETGAESRIRIFFAGKSGSMTKECIYQREMAASSGISEESELSTENATLIVDGLFGIGLTRDVTGEFAEIIEKINASNAVKVALDIPSGINADTGAVMGTAVKAQLTVTFGQLKIGGLLYPGASHCGKIIKADIGIEAEALNEALAFTSKEKAPFSLPPRDPASNKGTYGKVLIVGGAPGMAGAAYLSALGAYRCGAGLVRIFTSEENRVILQALLPEAVVTSYEKNATSTEISMLLSDAVKGSDAVAVGPGLSMSDTAFYILKTVLETAKCPIVIDADALNILASEKGACLWSLINSPAVITPHIGELSRLSKLSVEKLKSNIPFYCKETAQNTETVCVAKDARTAVSDGERLYINQTGCSGLSKGGSGDVLSGVIAALLGMGADAFEAASTGVWLHGKSGECASDMIGEYSLLARDIANFLPRAIEKA